MRKQLITTIKIKGDTCILQKNELNRIKGGVDAQRRNAAAVDIIITDDLA